MKNYSVLVGIVLLLSSTCGYSQFNQENDLSHDHNYDHDHDHDVYDISWRKDLPIIGVGLTAAAIGGYVIAKVDTPLEADILRLDKSDIWSFDRGAAGNFSKTAETISDVILYSSFAIPFALHAFDECRGAGKEMLVITLETALVINALTNFAKASTLRFRPYNYNPAVENDVKLRHGSRLSFFSGHVSHTAAFWFMTAQILTDMHPHWKSKSTLTWGIAATLPIAIGAGRILAGKHFPTDVITGYVVGASVGLIMPIIHRNKKLSTVIGPNGVGVSLNLN